jgi:hypothetical protein
LHGKEAVFGEIVIKLTPISCFGPRTDLQWYHHPCRRAWSFLGLYQLCTTSTSIAASASRSLARYLKNRVFSMSGLVTKPSQTMSTLECQEDLQKFQRMGSEKNAPIGYCIWHSRKRLDRGVPKNGWVTSERINSEN